MIALHSESFAGLGIEFPQFSVPNSRAKVLGRNGAYLQGFSNFFARQTLQGRLSHERALRPSPGRSVSSSYEQKALLKQNQSNLL